MGSPFDGLEKAVSKTIMTLMGYPSSWTPSGGSTLEGRMGVKMKTPERETQAKNFNPKVWIIEFYKDVFPGLFESVRDGNIETVTVDGVDYSAFKTASKYDGDTLCLECRKLIS